MPHARRRAAIFLILTLHRLESSFELSGHAAQPSRITSANHQTVFKPPFMTASALPLDFMTVESSTRWLPRRPKPSAQSQGGCATSGLTTGHQPQSFGRRLIVCEPFRRVELSSINSVFLYVSVAPPTQPKARTGTEQLRKRYFQDRVPEPPRPDTRLLGPGLDHHRPALSFGPASLRCLTYLDHRSRVEFARRCYHQTRRPCCPRAKLINGLFENTRFRMGYNLHVLRQARESQTKFMNVCWNISD